MKIATSRGLRTFPTDYDDLTLFGTAGEDRTDEFEVVFSCVALYVLSCFTLPCLALSCLDHG
jgi:hypothetical protein